MPMLKSALCAAALALTGAVAFPVFAQQSGTDNSPGATQAQPAPGPGDERGPRWRGERDDWRGGGGDERGERWGRRFEGRRGYDGGERGGYGRDRMGEREGMMRGRREMRGPCGPQGGRFGEAMIDRLERATRPTAEQQAIFDKLKDAAMKAAGIVRAACPAEPALTPTGRLAVAEKRLTAMLEAVRTVRPAMDAFYGSLSDEQKARLTMARGHMRRMGPPDGWRGRERNGDDGAPHGDRTSREPDDSATQPERL